MAKYRIVHETEYTYSSEVFHEPHIFRFKPKNNPHYFLEEFSINVFPEPIGISEQLDAENNIVHFCWLEGKGKILLIKAESVIQVKEFNPFNFIIYPSHYSTIPFTYDDHLSGMLSAALRKPNLSQPLVNYAQEIKRSLSNTTIDFIIQLTRKISNDFKLESRKHGRPLDPEVTFEFGKGSCRDLAWLQIQLFRYFGIASRFASGYFYILSDDPEYELHAWVEVFIPGAGWIGMDPSHGIVCDSSHLPIASGVSIDNIMTVTGSVRGDASSTLKTKLNIQKIA